uniref:Calbindin 2 n=1 Tax=Sus scrofa TaxID=9823 RepID=A0A8D1EX11_PIG
MGAPSLRTPAEPLGSRRPAETQANSLSERAPCWQPGVGAASGLYIKAAWRARPGRERGAEPARRESAALPEVSERLAMAGPQQQPPYLHLAELTASQFLEIWKHFDADGNGYIEGKELENFFQELEKARKGSGMVSKSDNLGEKMKEFMQKYDKNADGKIEMAEAWRKYDTDRSGYIEANELKGFLSDLLKKANRPYDEPKLQEYTQTILRMFDLNGDGKLGLSEMSRLLPVQENFLLKFQGMKLTAEEFNAIFTFYDKDGSGYIDENELDALLKDLYEKNKKEMNIQQLTNYRKSVMSLAEAGKLYRKDLEIVLCSEPPM